MSALTSLLVRDQTVSVRKIEEAIQRQVISGGELESVLLGMGAVEENVMSAYLAALHGLLPATRNEVMEVPKETRRAVPRDAAAKYRLVPLAVEERTLVVAITAPLSRQDEEELGFLLSFDVVYRIVCEVRLAAALSHYYQIDALPRMRRLAEKLHQRDPGRVPYVAPLEEQNGEEGAAAPSMQPSAVIDWDDEEEGPEVTLVELGPPSFDGSADSPRTEPSDSDRRTDRPPAAVLAEIEGAVGRPTAPQKRSSLSRKLRGPLTAKAAVELLKQAGGRDEILEIFFVFARQFFDYTALFVVHDNVAEGRDAHGDGTVTDDLLQMAVPLDAPSLFANAREGLAPVVGTLSGTQIDLAVAQDLARDPSLPAVVAPVTIRKRLVLMLYGDRGGEAFQLSDVPELVGMLPRVSDAFLALLVRIKRGSHAAGAPAGQAKNVRKAREVETEPEFQAVPVPVPVIEAAPGPAPEAAPAAEATPAPAAEATPAPAAEAAPTPVAEVAPAVSRQSEPEVSAVEPPSKGGSNLLGKLGVPRSAPPPPNVVGAMDFQLDKKATRPDGHAAIAQQHNLGHPEDPNFPPMAAGTAGDVEPHSRPGGEQDLPGFAKSQIDRPQTGSYQLSGGGAEVLGRAKPTAQPAPSEPAKRRPVEARENPTDPRREQGASSTPVDVVDVPDVSLEEQAEPEPVRQTVPQPAPNMPSVIVDMGGTVEDLVDDLEKCGPDGEGGAILALLSMGESALPTMTQRFPGPLWFDRDRPHRRLPHGRDISALARGLVAFRERAIPYVISLTEAQDDSTRFYGTLLASEFVARDLLRPVGLRVFDADLKTRLLAVDVLRRFVIFSKEMEEFIKGLRLEARVDRKDLDRRCIAIRAIGLLRDVRSTDLLVELLNAKEPSLVREAHEALQVLTRQDFGDSSRRWKQWVERNQDRHRIEWLIDALSHSDEGARAAAIEELQVLSQEYYGYHPGLPRHDREVAQKRYRKWWKSEGQARFT